MAQARRRRGSLSHSPLAHPRELVHALAARVQEYLFLPQPEPLYVVLGTVAAAMMKGPPVWTMLIGAPSSGRTALLEALATSEEEGRLIERGKLAPAQRTTGVDRVHLISVIGSPGALLSGVSSKEVRKGATGGVLRQLGSRGVLVMKDFTSTLSMPIKDMIEMLGAYREIFDGRWSRGLGVEGGRVLEWRGKIGFLGACTYEIDRYANVIGKMGERWVYYRYPDTDGYGEARAAVRTRDPKYNQDQLRRWVRQFFIDIGLEWDDEERRELTALEWNRIIALSMIATKIRSTVSRTRGWGAEVADIAHSEGPARMSASLGQLYLGLERIGLDAKERWRVIRKITLDSTPQVKAALIVMAKERAGDADGGSSLKLDDARKKLMVGGKAVGRAAEDLVIHGILEWVGRRRDDGLAVGVRLSPWAVERMEDGFGR